MDPTSENQSNKSRVRLYWEALDNAASEDTEQVCLDHLDKAFRWNGPEPLGRRVGPSAVADAFWGPLKHAIPNLKRETHMDFGGASSGLADGSPDGRMWVCGTGYFSGTPTGPFLGIPTVNRSVRIRWGEFLRFDRGQIVESQMLVDFVDWFEQIGLPVLPQPCGAAHVYPSPTAFDGILKAEQDSSETEETLALGRELIFDGLNRFDRLELSKMGMSRFFHPNIKWYGPGGIGACLSLTEFEALHQRPWLAAFPDRKVQNLDALFAEGRLLGACGVAGVRGTHSGQYLDHPATGNSISFSGLDFWLRSGGKFTENWVFVDMCHLFAQFGVDLFALMREQATAQGIPRMSC